MNDSIGLYGVILLIIAIGSLISIIILESIISYYNHKLKRLHEDFPLMLEANEDLRRLHRKDVQKTISKNLSELEGAELEHYREIANQYYENYGKGRDGLELKYKAK